MSKRSEKSEKKLGYYWDTYRSWVEKLEDGYPRIFLFQGHPRGVPRSICNFSGQGTLPYGQRGEVVGVGVQVVSSSDHIGDIIRANSVMVLSVADKESFQMPLSLSIEEYDRSQLQDGDMGIPGGIIKMFGRSVPIPPRVQFNVRIDFDSSAESLIRRIETRVGPGAGWVEVISYLVVETDYSV